MKKNDLVKILTNNNVPQQMYSFGEIGRGECYCVTESDGLWKVSYVEKDRVSDIQTGLREDEAYDIVYEEFKSMFRW